MTDKAWITLMELGGKTGCHQLAERSFFAGGRQFPVCARCLGVYIGQLIAYVFCVFRRPNVFVSLAAAGAMLLDWLLQYKKILKSTNIRRLITGILGGFGVISLFITLFRTIYCRNRYHGD